MSRVRNGAVYTCAEAQSQCLVEDLNESRCHRRHHSDTESWNSVALPESTIQGVALYVALVSQNWTFLLRKMVLVPLPCCIIWCPNAFPYKSRVKHVFLR